jgi:hypothetical protein
MGFVGASMDHMVSTISHTTGSLQGCRFFTSRCRIRRFHILPKTRHSANLHVCRRDDTPDDQNLMYQVDSDKHGPGRGKALTVSAMVRYGSYGHHRLKGMTPQDLQLADSTLDLEMMQALSYQPSACC